MEPGVWSRVAVAAVLLLVVAACAPVATTSTSAVTSSTLRSSTTSTTPVVASTTSPTTTSTTVPDPRSAFIEQSIGSMSIGDKAAQLLMIEFVGSDGSMAGEYLAGYPVGGFLLKSANGNLVSSVQLREMISLLQTASEIPLLIAVDQEGGRIDRIRFDDFQRFPSAEVFGLLNDAKLTERASWATGVQLAALGVNVDFAPVADVNVLGDLNPAIGDRAYGGDPDLVATMAVAAVRGFNRAGIAAAVKHFPGHGNTAVDSHLGLPVILTPSEEWAKTDRVPFEASIQAGVLMVMVGHVAYPALDADGLPASLSRAITYGQLRTDLGFTGVIVTDDLANMGAVAAWTSGERVVRALMAGSDLLLNPGDVAAAVSAIEEAVADGRISEQAVDGALARLFGLKFDLGMAGTDANGTLDAALVEAVASVGQDVANACLTAGLDC